MSRKENASLVFYVWAVFVLIGIFLFEFISGGEILFVSGFAALASLGFIFIGLLLDKNRWVKLLLLSPLIAVNLYFVAVKLLIFLAAFAAWSNGGFAP